MLSVFLVKIKAVVFDFCTNKSLGRVEICTKRVSDDEKEGEKWLGLLVVPAPSLHREI